MKAFWGLLFLFGSNVVFGLSYDSGAQGNPPIGVTNGSDAGAGVVGQFVSSCAATLGVFAASTQFDDPVQILLTPGDWDVTARMDFSQQGSTYTSMNLGISSTTGNSSAGLTLGDTRLNVGFANAVWETLPSNFALTLPNIRASLTTNTTYYLKAASTYSAGTPQRRGCIEGRRRR